MPRYFFDLNDGALTYDEAGVVCPNLQAAGMEALERAHARFAGAVVLRDGAIIVTIRDDCNSVLMTIRMVLQFETPLTSLT